MFNQCLVKKILYAARYLLSRAGSKLVKPSHLIYICIDAARQHPVDKEKYVVDGVHDIVGYVGMQHLHHVDLLPLILQLLQLGDITQENHQPFLLIIDKALLTDNVVTRALNAFFLVVYVIGLLLSRLVITLLAESSDIPPLKQINR